MNGGYNVEMFDEYGDSEDSGEAVTVKSLDKAVKIVKRGPSNEPGEWLISHA